MSDSRNTEKAILFGGRAQPSGDKFFTAGKDSAVRLWDLGNQDGPKLVHRYRFEGRNVAATAVAYHPSGRLRLGGRRR